MKNVTVAAKTTFRYSEQTVKTIKTGAAKQAEFLKTFAQLRADTFVYNFAGFNITQHQRFVADILLNHIANALEFCANYKEEQEDNNLYYLYTCVGSIDMMHKEYELSDEALLYEVFKNSLFHKWINERPMSSEIKKTLDLWDWVTDIILDVQQDYEDYKSDSN